MKVKIVIILSVLLSASYGFSNPIKDKVAREVLLEANSFKEMLVDEKIENYVNKLHPKVISMMGGRERVIMSSKKNNFLMKKKKLKLIKYEVDRPENIYRSKDEFFTFLKTHIIIDSPVVEISKTTYLIAVKNKKDEGWYFIDGGRINNFEGLGKFFSEFPRDVEIPKNSRKIIHK